MFGATHLPKYTYALELSLDYPYPCRIQNKHFFCTYCTFNHRIAICVVAENSSDSYELIVTESLHRPFSLGIVELMNIVLRMASGREFLFHRMSRPIQTAPPSMCSMNVETELSAICLRDILFWLSFCFIVAIIRNTLP